MDRYIFKDGIKFECQGSANCCVSRGSFGYVYLSKKDLIRLANFFNISAEEFKKKYCSFTEGFLHLNELKNNGDCLFLKNKKCSVYKARPSQCRTWPFWSENMTMKTWNKEVLNFCPGIGKGKLFNKDKITKLINIDKENAKKIYKD